MNTASKNLWEIMNDHRVEGDTPTFVIKITNLDLDAAENRVNYMKTKHL